MYRQLLAALAVSAGIVTIYNQSEAREDLFIDNAHCIALNIYHESLWEPIDGKYAVAYVVMNRVRDPAFPDSPCEVVFEGPSQPSWKDETVLIPVKNQCQFSWYCDGKSDNVTNMALYEECFRIALNVMAEYGTIAENDPTNGSLWYHADYVDPDWNDIYVEKVKLGRHIFYGRE
jgi:spore germination cell wall hydrolase CwlJ-like protein